jgi:hypothetical protein
MVNGRTFVLGAIGRAGVSVQLALAGRAVASMGSATEEASQSGILQWDRHDDWHRSRRAVGAEDGGTRA